MSSFFPSASDTQTALSAGNSQNQEQIQNSYIDAKAADLRVASFNASLSRDIEGQLIADLSAPDDPQAKAIAEIIQKSDADIILINEFDFDANG
ncbi:MAG: endonuclease/exonuclease/phosphatase family protein, partial [Pseudomonadota bacterium]